MSTYTAEQIEAIGGRRWTKGDKDRVYLNADVWAPMIGLVTSHYNTGNISYAELNGNKISNGRAYRALSIKVYWEGGRIWITRDAEFADEIREAIAEAVAALNSHDDTQGQSQDIAEAPAATTVAKLREAGRTARQIAAAIGVSVSTIYRWARGICRPRPVNAAALAALA